MSSNERLDRGGERKGAATAAGTAAGRQLDRDSDLDGGSREWRTAGGERRREKGDAFSVGDFVGREDLTERETEVGAASPRLRVLIWGIYGVNRVERGLEERELGDG